MYVCELAKDLGLLLLRCMGQDKVHTSKGAADGHSVVLTQMVQSGFVQLLIHQNICTFH